jgi:hypothetical protein
LPIQVHPTIVVLSRFHIVVRQVLPFRVARMVAFTCTASAVTIRPAPPEALIALEWS